MQRGGIKRGNQWTVRFAINNPGKNAMDIRQLYQEDAVQS